MPSPEPGFEQRLRKIIGQRAQAHLRPEVAPIIARLLNRAAPLLSWDRVIEVLQSLDVPEDAIHGLWASYQEATRYRRPPKPSLPRPLVRQGTGPPAYVPRLGGADVSRERSSPGVSAAKPRRVLEDADGYDQKPNPLAVSIRPRTFSELDELLLKYWAWAGYPSSRQLAKLSEGAFSHATVNKLTGEKSRDGSKPFSTRQDYVVAFIRACGGNENDQMSWVSAWRQIACSGDAP
jgi:hypothetical protein